MGFEHESGHVAVRFRADGVSGVAALHGYLLRFSVSYVLTAWNNKFGVVPSVFHNFDARVEVKPNRLRLGNPQAEVPLVLTAHEHQQSGTMAFELMLAASTIEKIEELRAGGGFEVFLRLSGERIGERHAEQYDEILFRITQSDWVAVLKQMNFGNYMLCEIPIELGNDDDLREVWHAMTKARELLYTGHYSNAVMESRKALEAAIKRFGLDSDIKSASQKYQGTRTDRMSMSKRERLLNLINSANHVTHLSAHPDTNNRVIDYSREEALLIFGVIATAISGMAR